MFIVYKTTNIINGKYYIGVHHKDSTKAHKHYLGSGALLKKAFKKYGRDNFIRETLFEFSTLEDALAKEREIVNEEFVADGNNYNLALGGSIPPNSKTWWTTQHSERLKNRMKNNSYRLGVKDSDETKLKKSMSMKKSDTIGRWKRTDKHKAQSAERARKQMMANNPMSNPEFRSKVAESKIGRKKVVDNEGRSKYARPEEIEFYLKSGYILAKP